MPNTFELIASSTVGAGGAASIDFTSIPATFTDLCVKISARDSSANTLGGVYFKFNGSTSGYSQRLLYGTGSSAGSGSNITTDKAFVTDTTANTATANTFGSQEVYIPNYAGSNQKSYSADGVTENNATAAYPELVAGLWTGTAAISSINISAATSFMQHSTFYLYGVKNA